MTTHKVAEGVEVTIPEQLRISTTSPHKTRRLNRIPTSGAVPMPSDSDKPSTSYPILDALAETGMQLVREVVIEPAPQMGSSSRISPVGSQSVEFKIDLTKNEEAVMLIEQDGMYLWKYASQTLTVPSVRRRGGDVDATEKQVVFQVDIATEMESAAAETRRNLLGELKELAWDKMKAYIFKFIAGAAVELARNQLERDVSRGLVLIESTDPETWQVVSGLDKVALPTNRAPKIFLFIHGTFSSTVGAFGVLGATPWGKSFLEAVLRTHDAVIGFNHATLSEDPLQNARQLLDSFQAVDWPVAPQINAVVHSRGGLVLRCLIEKLLPQGTWQPTFNRVVFVATTNGGTLLAEPENWQNLVNFYTNLTAGVCRVIGLIAPQSKIATVVLSDVVQSIGSFIKYCADSAVTDKLVPGLSAMEPDGDFIKDINGAKIGQFTSKQSYYCVITSEFKPRLSGDHEPKELPLRFLNLLAGTFIGQLMKEANDLVVNTESMAAIDLASGSFIEERYDFGENTQVYHTNYFTRPEVANALTRWFNLSTVKPDQTSSDHLRPIRRKRSGGGSDAPSVLQPLFPKEPLPVDLILPPSVDTDIITIDADSPIKPLQTEILKNLPSYVVVRRPYQGTMLNYAIGAEEALGMLQFQNDALVIDTFNLREIDASKTQSVGDAITARKYTPGSLTAARGVILFNDVPVGVVPEKKELPDAEALARTAQLIADPKTEEERIVAKRTMPTFAPNPKANPQSGFQYPKEDINRCPYYAHIRKSNPEPKVTCYFRADMDAEVVIKRITTLVVTISRETLEQITTELSTIAGVGNVRSDKKILVRVITRSRFNAVDASEGQADVDVPSVNEPLELSFDVRATEEEGEGEIWILFRQEQVSVAKLVLKPKVVKTRSQYTETVSAERKINDPKPLDKPLHQLDIEERKTNDGFIYLYSINSPDFKIKRRLTSKQILGDREKYVASLYKRIEDRWLSSNGDIENFQQELRAFGADLFDELIPAELQTILWERRHDFDNIQVISGEPFIPWELIHLRDPDRRGMPEETIFMAQLGLIRWLDGAGQNGWPTDRIRIREGRVRYVIPKYPHPDYKLPEAEEEAIFLKNKFAAIEVKPESGEVRKLLAKPGEFDLLHFACHGVAESDSINEASLLMLGRVEAGKYVLDSLNSTVAAKFSNLKADDNEPIVVLNACQAGRAGYKLTGIGGFADAFLMGGAGAFVGTLWSVGDGPARTFTETLYEALEQGKSLSEATIEARNAAKSAGEATWLAYVVYGHPHLKITG